MQLPLLPDLLRLRDPGGHSTWASAAPQQKATSSITAQLPVVIDDHDALAIFHVTDTYFRQATADVGPSHGVA